MHPLKEHLSDKGEQPGIEVLSTALGLAHGEELLCCPQGTRTAAARRGEARGDPAPDVPLLHALVLLPLGGRGNSARLRPPSASADGAGTPLCNLRGHGK